MTRYFFMPNVQNHRRPGSVRTRKLVALVSLSAAFGMLVSGCSQTSQPGSTATSQASATASNVATDSAIDLAGMDAKTIVSTLDQLKLSEKPTDLMVSVRPQELLITDSQGTESSVEMPSDEFYLSIAPYLESTHECHFHSLTTCRGELANENVRITIVDSATGITIVDESATTYDNGFVGVWLPKGIDASLTVESNGKSARTDISTKADDDASCLTTLQLV